MSESNKNELKKSLRLYIYSFCRENNIKIVRYDYLLELIEYGISQVENRLLGDV